YRAGLARGSLLHGSLAVDLSVTALLGPLLSGGRVEVVAASGADGMLEAIGREAPGLLKVTPSHLALLDPASRPAVLVVGGEQLAADVIRPWCRPGTEVFNEYGPTEATVGCCLHELARPPAAGRGVPIGRPVANTQAYVL